MKLARHSSKEKSKNEINMTEGPILSRMLMFALPIMASSILQLLFNAADIIVVGRFAGDDSLAAVGSTTSLINLMVNIFIGMSIGANVLAARYYGAQKDKELSQTLHTAVSLSLISGVALAVIGLIFAEPILHMMQTPDDVLKLASVYLRIYFLGMPATMVYNFGASVLRAKGDTRRPLYYLTLAGVVNVGLNLYFVIVLDMNVVGVAAATAIAQCISAVLVIRCLTKEEGALRLEFKKLRINRQRLLGILQVGLPAGFQGALFSLSNVIIQSAINSFGDTVMAGNAAASNLENFVYFGMNAFAQAAISFTSQNLGAGKYERLIPIAKCSVLCALVTGLALGISCYLAGPVLLGIYSESSAVIAKGMVRLSFVCLPYAICGIMDTMVGLLRGLGYSVVPMIVSLVGACLSRIIWIATVFQIPAYHNVQIVYVSYPATWIITTFVHIVCFLWIMENRIKPRMEAQEHKMTGTENTISQI